MVFFVSAGDVYDLSVYPHLLDGPEDGAFDGIRYQSDPTELDLSPIEIESFKAGRTALSNGYPVKGDAAPKKMLWDGNGRKMPDILLYQHYAVSDRLKCLIEEFEPDVHQFFPVQVYEDKNLENATEYYWLNVCNRIDSVDRENTTYEWAISYTGRGFWDRGTARDARVVFSREKTRPYHLWVDTYLAINSHFFVSDEFAKQAEAADFLGLVLTKQESI